MTTLAALRRWPHPAAFDRLNALFPLDRHAADALDSALGLAIRIPARRDLAVEGKPIRDTRIVVEGWAARVRIHRDGRRQFLSFLLPGDLIGSCRQPDPVSTSTVTALTALRTAAAPSAVHLPTLATAYAMSAAMEEAYLLDHISRLGRLNAQERLLHMMLELYERLALAGLAAGGSFDMPLTQEILADALGLTPVHLNRMIQMARRANQVVWASKRVTITDPDCLAQQIGRRPVRVSASLHCGAGLPTMTRAIGRAARV